jgi:proline dehydrogenase
VSAFIPLMRGAFLYFSRQPQLRRWVETSPSARKFTSRFIAGLTLDDALAAARRLRAIRTDATLDYLGENVQTLAEATASRDAYFEALNRNAANNWGQLFR